MKILDLLNRRTKWTQFTRARNKQGDRVPPCDPHAVCWCLIGAADKCYPDLVKRQKAFDKISEALTGLCYARAHMAIEHELFKRGWKSIVAFNDCTLTTFQQLREVIIAANV